MPPLIVTLQVPYPENEQQFLLQAVEAAVRAFRSLNGSPAMVSGKYLRRASLKTS